jgi:NADH:ubiquinone oxidoreductase subunit 5 (subunit L)/multisubunit Na+/H+ antiporter MnhA subunit
MLKLFLSEWFFISFRIRVSSRLMKFLILLIKVFFRILLFRNYYLREEKFFVFYILTMFIFVLRIVILLIRKKIFMILIGWDLLGVKRFLLVNFYLTWDKVNKRMNTVISNRVGDFFLFLTIITWLQEKGLKINQKLMIMLGGLTLVLTSFTKKAQFPFKGWLPKAIAAPTPVRALVHRRTLVTAGLLLLFKFNYRIFNSNILNLLFWIGFFTMIIASFSAFVEEDVKKVVALKTLSQIGLATITMGLGFVKLSFLHLISHGFFKKLLFIQVGYFIHQARRQQDPRDFLQKGRIDYFVQLQLIVRFFKLCGLFFFNGLVTKDLILELWWGISIRKILSLIFFFSIVLTFFYRIRLWKALFMNGNWRIFHRQSSLVFKTLKIRLMIYSISFMWWMKRNLLSSPSVFIYCDIWAPLVFLIVFFILKNYISNWKLKWLVSKFQVDYFLLISRWLLIDLKKLDRFSFKSEVSFTGFYLFSASVVGRYLFSGLNWLWILISIIILFWL